MKFERLKGNDTYLALKELERRINIIAEHIPDPKKKVKKTLWIGVSNGGHTTNCYETKEEVQNYASQGGFPAYITIVPVEIEVEE